MTLNSYIEYDVCARLLMPRQRIFLFFEGEEPYATISRVQCLRIGQRRPVYAIRAATLALPPGTTSHDLLDYLTLLYRSTKSISLSLVLGFLNYKMEVPADTMHLPMLFSVQNSPSFAHPSPKNPSVVLADIVGLMLMHNSHLTPIDCRRRMLLESPTGPALSQSLPRLCMAGC